jgi:hypothetical protein
LAFDFKPFDPENPYPLLDFKDFEFEFKGDDWQLEVF